MFIQIKIYREHIAVWEQKTGKENILIVNQHAKEALEYYRKTLLHYHKNDYIFQGKKSGPEPLSRSQAFRIIKKAANYYGLSKTSAVIPFGKRLAALPGRTEHRWLS